MFLIILAILAIFTAINSMRLDGLEKDYYNMQRKEALARNKLMFIQDDLEKVEILKTNPWSVIRKIEETINSDQTIR